MNEAFIISDMAAIRVEQAYVEEEGKYFVRVCYGEETIMVLSADAGTYLGIELTTASSSAMGENHLLVFMNQHVKKETINRWMRNYVPWLRNRVQTQYEDSSPPAKLGKKSSSERNRRFS
jgi:hypothetical protein